MAFLKTLILGPKKPEGPSKILTAATARQAERAREDEKRESETLQAQFRRALSSGRNLLISGFRGGAAGGGLTGAGAGGTTAGGPGGGPGGVAGGAGGGGGFTPPGGPPGGGPQF